MIWLADGILDILDVIFGEAYCLYFFVIVLFGFGETGDLLENSGFY